MRHYNSTNSPDVVMSSPIFDKSQYTSHYVPNRRFTTGWTVRGSNPGGGKIFSTCPDRPWGPPSLLYNGAPGLSQG